MMQSSAPRFRIPRDVWIGLAAFALGAWYWRAAGDIPISPLDGVVNASALPRMLATAMMVFSVLLILRALLVEVMYLRAARRAAGPPADRPEAEGHGFTPRQHVKAAGVVTIGIAYLLILPWLGYVPSVILLVVVMSVYIGARAGAYTLGVAVVLAVAFYLLFVRLLGIPLPAGFWPSLFG
ncbi:tripartite tricarboxylate transporter TctB family protein [Aliigemmobacter aestuarii]|uniref:Tripartite tricarboxylate transporter TctB family protein n=1 Tax=Aliigemmobacter aestuarii TaxID=1445661 RepID=A0A4S3MLT1_9RHOB|nr:tripartite tricarboxylate transporter TctB family protein [Gemmobacter aestuarii]THD82762.1 tripartite tricarboxylate transporter TctB family protein [Gemmobacter aestuarii]